MILTLINNILGHQPDDFWYDVQMDIVQEALENCKISEWQELYDFLPFTRKEENWCLLECLGTCINSNAVRCIEKIILSENDLETIKFAILSIENQDISLLERATREKILAFSAKIFCATDNEVLRTKLERICDRMR